MDNVGLILVGHGSRRPQHKETLEKLAEIIRAGSRFKFVGAAFMMIDSPTIEEAIRLAAQHGIKRVVVVPVFIGAGSHTVEDIPRILGLEDGKRATWRGETEVIYGEPIGPDRRVAEIIEDKALQALGYNMGEDQPPDPLELPTSNVLFETSLERIREIMKDLIKDVPPGHAKIIERVVHATADPTFAKDIVISDNAVGEGIRAIRSGAKVVVDVKMVKVGLNSANLRKFGCKVKCYVDDYRATEMAREMNITRTAAAMRLAIEEGLDGGIVVIGNSPTATFEVVRAVRGGEAKPALIIAAPVGLIGAAEAKRAVTELPIPYITVSGPRGGSPVAVAAFNALLALAEKYSEV